MSTVRFAVGAVITVLATSGPLAGQNQVTSAASIDLASPIDDVVRLNVEPLVLGRATIGVSLALWWGAEPLSANRNAVPGCAGCEARLLGLLGDRPREYQLDLAARWYPAFLSLNVPRRRVSVYVGAGAGLHRREAAEPQSCTGFRCPAGAPRIVAHGIEPHGELGARLHLVRQVFLDIGGRARVISFADPTRRFAIGDIDPRVTFAAGIGW